MLCILDVNSVEKYESIISSRGFQQKTKEVLFILIFYFLESTNLSSPFP